MKSVKISYLLFLEIQMPQFSRLWIRLFLAGLTGAALIVVSASVVITATPTQATAQNNPCAAKKGANVGGPLAKELRGKPVVVDIYASWCPACKNIAPTLSRLQEDYDGKAHFIVLDVSDKSKARQAEARAKQLGLDKFFAAHKSQTGLVAIIDPATGDILAQHRNNPTKSAYSSVLNAAIAKK